MGIDVLESMERDERAMERIAQAFEVVANTLVAWYKLEQQRFEREYPAHTIARESTFSRIPTAEEELKTAQGATGEKTIDEWMQLGPRERAVVEKSPESTEQPTAKKKG